MTSDLKVLLIIPTAGDRQRLALLEETWLSRLRTHPHIQPLLIGQHCVHYDFPETYQMLPYKVADIFRLLSQLTTYAWDYVFKCDDDTYVHVERLHDFPLDHPYIGCRVYPGDAWAEEPPYASGGAGYFLSREAVDRMTPKFPAMLRAPYPVGAEDLLVGRCLHASGIPLHHSPLFVPYGNHELRPLPNNHIITTHRIKPDLFLQTHQENYPDAPPLI